jgi:hypothetical protein
MADLRLEPPWVNTAPTAGDGDGLILNELVIPWNFRYDLSGLPCLFDPWLIFATRGLS